MATEMDSLGFYGDDDLELAWREKEDDLAGHGYEGDARRCAAHPNVVISSPCGMFDGLCGECEGLADQAHQESEPVELEPVDPGWAAFFSFMNLPPAPEPKIEPDDIPF